MDRNPLKDCLAEIEAALKRGDATEHTHRPALKTLIEALAGSGVQAVNEPRRSGRSHGRHKDLGNLHENRPGPSC